MAELPERYTGLSKYLSYTLRHHPEDTDLDIDDHGWADMDEVVRAVKRTKHSWAGREDIARLVEESEKNRFELKEGEIRALYGHSIEVDISGDVEPPGTLYHGTSPDDLKSIMDQGLKPMGRNYVHLSKDREEAERVGRRHSSRPVILKIDAEEAYRDGLPFLDRGDVILCDKVPPEYIELDQKL